MVIVYKLTTGLDLIGESTDRENAILTNPFYLSKVSSPLHQTREEFYPAVEYGKTRVVAINKNAVLFSYEAGIECVQAYADAVAKINVQKEAKITSIHS